MTPDPRKIAIAEHQRWLGYLQPEGLVVSPLALVDAQVQLDTGGYAAAQERFVDALKADPATGEPIVEHFGYFACAFLDWKDSLHSVWSVAAEVPEALRISTGEHGELLRPDGAYRAFRPAEANRPWLLLYRQLPLGEKLDELPDAKKHKGWIASQHQKFERLLKETGVPIGILCNGSLIRLVYAPKGENSGSLTFPVSFMTQIPGRAVASALDLLLSNRRLNVVPEAVRLPGLLRKSRDYQAHVSNDLADQVLIALYELVSGFQAADAKAAGALLREALARNPDEIYHGLLTVLLRLVFLLFAEDRSLMPRGPLYQQGYSLQGLFEQLRSDHERYPDIMDDRFAAWPRLLALFRAIHRGCKHREMTLPARQGHLFDPDRFPFLEGRVTWRDPIPADLPRVSDGCLYRILNLLLYLDGERLSYRTLDVEQIGSVYQTMIGFTLEAARGTSIALKPAKSKGAPAFLDLDALLAIEPGKRAEQLQKLTDHKLTGKPLSALKEACSHDDLLAALDRKIHRRASPDKVPPGSLILQPTDERRRSGSHYTPRALTAPIVKKTLDPIFARLGDHPTPQQILDLKVCDPAVGSGAFLVEACRQLGRALVDAWQHHGGKPVIPLDEDEQRHAERLVAQRCLYGVDRNPMAVDLAKLSLWLATLAKDHPFTFLDHSLRAGDALVGLRKQQIIDFHWLDRDRLTDALKAATAARDPIAIKAIKKDLDMLGTREFGQQDIQRRIEVATSHRREILEGGDYMLPSLKATRLANADDALDKVRRAGDLCLAAFFNGDKAKARTVLRESYLDTLLETGKGFQPDKINAVERLVAQLRSGKPHSVTPFHWEIEFPEVFARENGGFDAFIGNPPYGGKNTVIEGNHESYTDWLKALHAESHGNADLVAHFFRRAFNLLRRDGTFGLIATNTIRQGDTRHTGLRWICVNGGTIYAARRRYKWAGAAAVTVSVVWVLKGMLPAPFDLDGKSVSIITAYLFHDGGHENPAVLDANASKSFQGSIVLGMGFTFDDETKDPLANSLADMNALIERDSRNGERIFPYLGGDEVNDSPTHAFHRFVISFFDFPRVRSELTPSWEEADEKQRDAWMCEGVVPLDYPDPVAADWPDLLNIVETRVKPDRDDQKRDALRNRWWQFAEKRPGLTRALAPLERALVISRVTEHPGFVFIPTKIVCSERLVVFPIEAPQAFALLQSRLHEIWARFFSATQEDRLMYAPSDCFETFPFPAGWETHAALEAAGRAYYEFRAELMVANNEGLTTTYNRFHDPAEDAPAIQRLRELHAAMDHAVLTAYGWSDLIEQGRTTCEFIPDYYDEPEQDGGDPIPKSIRYRWPDATRDEVLARLLKLNAERAAAEAAATACGAQKNGARNRSASSAKKSFHSARQSVFQREKASDELL